MKKLKSLLLIFIPLVFISSCTVLSFYPLYTEKELVRDDRIIGDWQSLAGSNDDAGDTIYWRIEFKQNDKKTNKYTYTLSLHYNDMMEDGAVFQLHIVKLDGKTYLDFYPEEGRIENEFFMQHLMPVHTFAKLEIGEELNIVWFDSDWLENLFGEDKIRIRHEEDEDRILLTAKPEELQKFIIKYANDEKVFSKHMRYILSK
ncbi:hypothetical protein R9C00_25975 [Flammeovirgaceae bacterium SG7u.111]|nr:hypothetical protein [Flammeovirgaceae bacterium SG7u.132]WPO35147.1 hypothetical protein R9C00_25975 [Flammeovirgaceae bacterium SG7u.111]